MTSLNNSGDLLDRQPLSRAKRLALVIGVLFLAIFLSITAGAAGGAFAADVTQCNGDFIGTGGGDAIECHVTVVNNVDLSDPTQTFSTVTTTSCSRNNADPVFCNPTTTVTTSTLTHTIDQCNGSTEDGSSVYCTVDVLNQITGGTAPIANATVDECVGSAQGGTLVSMSCDGWTDPSITPPTAQNAGSGATVVQCDGSANGGGSLVDCSIDQGSTTSADLPVTVNQCNGSANGGGSAVICRVRMRTSTRASSAITSYTTTTTIPVTVPTSITAPVLLTLATPPVVSPPAAGVVPPITPVVTPPVLGPPAPTGTSRTGGSTTTSSRDRLANTGTLASTGTDPLPMAGIALMLLLFGTGAALTSKVVTTRRIS